MSKSASTDTSKKPPLSCAECRRLKLKCNRVWPCSSCEKRGLAELCPQGSLATRPRHKPPPPTPQHVLQRIYELQSRINELESALATLQSTVSPHPHPLLHSDSVPYLQRKLLRKAALEKAQERGLDAFSALGSKGDTGAESDESEEIVDALGTLSIAPDGKSRFFGPTAVSEVLSAGQESEPPTSNPHIDSLPVDIAGLAQSFPFATLTAAVQEVHERIRAYLPPLDRAQSLCAIYFSHASFVAYTVPEDELFEDIFFRLYGTRRPQGSSNPSHYDDPTLQYQWHHVPPDELSMFFSILALGALTDLSIEAFSGEAETYYQLSRALLTRHLVLTEPTLASVQSLFLGSYYEGLQSQGNSSRDCWIMMVLACKTGQIIGLHRDHSMFGLDEKEIQRRRLVFWEIHSMDLIESLAFGRPLSLSFAHTDTKMPVDTHATTNQNGEVEESFYSWKYRFCSEVLSVVSDHVLRVKTPSYVSALAADRKLREFKTTYGRSVQNSGIMDANSAAQLQMMLGTRETSMLYIHRVFFAHAVSTEPANPERSKYGRSVVTAFESARLIINGMQFFVRSHREFGARLWFLWNHLLSASFVLGSIVARSPRSSFASPAMSLLGNVCEVLKQTAVYGGRAEYMLPLVTRLREKGFNAQMEQHTGSPGNMSNAGSEDHDELAVIGGKTRVVHSSRHTSLSPSQIYTAPGTQSTPDLPQQVQPPHPNPDGYAAQQQPFAPPTADAYPAFQSTDMPTLETYWSQDFLHNIVDMGAPAQPQMVYSAPPEVNPPAAYAQLTPQQFAQFAYGDDPGMAPDVGSNGWQSLMHDLGI